MRLLFVIAAASLVLLAAQPAAAHWDRDWNWHRGGQSYYFRDLQQACGWGDRWACVQMGKIIDHRSATRGSAAVLVPQRRAEIRVVRTGMASAGHLFQV